MQKPLKADEMQMLTLYERDPFFRAYVTFYIQKDGEQALKDILPGLTLKKTRPKRKQFKYEPEQLAQKFVQSLDQFIKTMPTQKELEEITGIEQSVWSRMMGRSDFWSHIIDIIQKEFLEMEAGFKSQKEKRIHILHIAEKEERELQKKFGDIIQHKGKEVSETDVFGQSLTENTVDTSRYADPLEAAELALLKNKSNDELINGIMKKRPQLRYRELNEIPRETLEYFYLNVLKDQ